MECRGLVLVRVRREQIQPCRNSLTKDLSLIENYHGRVCGIGESVSVMDGSGWPPSTCVAVLEFETLNYAQKWFQCVPAVKQADWLQGVDIIRAPLTAGAPGQNYITVCAYSGVGESTLDQTYSKALQESLDKGGATWVVRPSAVQNFRGLWEPGKIDVIAWTTKEDADKWMTSGDNKDLHALRHTICRPLIVGFYLCPLRTERS